MEIKVIQLNHSDIEGGAARAAYRIHHALRDLKIDSKMYVNNATAGDWTINGLEKKISKLSARIRPHIGSLPLYLMKTKNSILHSPAILNSNWPAKINNLDADILNLHWVNSEMLSIADISRLRKPIVWTLHDMWPFCGAEHYTSENRWTKGYNSINRPEYESGVDINRWTWNRKRKLWRKPMNIVAPSQWIADCVKKSSLMNDWPVDVIPNPINTDIWKPIDMLSARLLLNLPINSSIILFGAMGGGSDPRKGFDLLLEALAYLRGTKKKIILAIFGQLSPENQPNLGFPIHYAGYLHDDLSLRTWYSAADLLVIPSRQDNLPNTGVEALACGTPVVAFDIGGMPDIIDHKISGYLAQPYNTEDLAEGIKWVLNNSSGDNHIRQNSRNKVLKKFDNRIVAAKYIKLYENLLN